MNRRDFIGAVLAILATGAKMEPENERRIIRALESIADSLSEIARKSRKRSVQAELDAERHELSDRDPYAHTRL